MPYRIVIVEDDPDQSHNYRVALQRQGYAVECHASRAAAEGAFAAGLPDLVILDIMLGEELDGGFTLCRQLLARKPDLPVIFLTSRADEIDRISGLRLGAWDYQTKPVSLQFLAERVSSLLRIQALRSQASQRAALQLGELELDEERLQVHWRGAPLHFTLTEFNLLMEMVRRHDERGASYDQLASATRQGVVENNTVNTHIRQLRKKFRALDPGFDCIQNVYGFGFRWSGSA